MTLHVVRHGRTADNAAGRLLGRADPGLDEVGWAQAAALASALTASVGRVDRIVSSPLRRCVETAEAIAAAGHPADAAAVTVEVDERFIELDYGEFDRVGLSAVPSETWAAWQADVHFRPPGGETLFELAERVGVALDEIAERAVDGEVVVVSHVSPIKAAMAWALGVGIETSWRSHVAVASWHRIAVRTPPGGGAVRPSLHAFNDVGHLAALPS